MARAGPYPPPPLPKYKLRGGPITIPTTVAKQSVNVRLHAPLVVVPLSLIVLVEDHEHRLLILIIFSAHPIPFSFLFSWPWRFSV